MTRTRFAVFALRRRIRSCFALGMVFALLAGAANGEDARKPRTDLYGDPLPPGAVARLGTIRLRHANSEMAFSADGKRLISCGCDGEVRVWDVNTGKLIQRKRLAWKLDEGERLDQIALLPNGTAAAAQRGGVVRLYDLKTGNECSRLPIKDTYGVLVFSPDGNMLAVQNHTDQTGCILHLWNKNDSKNGRTLGAMARSAAAFTSDGKRLAAIGSDKKMRVWNTATGAEINKSEDRFEINKNEDRFDKQERSLAFSPDGKVLAVGSKSSGKVRLLDAATLKAKMERSVPADIKADSIETLTYSSNGRWLAGAYGDSGPNNGGVVVWDITGAKKVRRLPECSGVDRLAFSSDSRTLAGHDAEGREIRLWDVSSGRPLHHRIGHDRPVRELVVSPDGKIIVSGDTTNALRLWDAATGKPLQMLQGENGIEVLLFAPDGKRMISVERFGIIQVWDATTGKPCRRFKITRTERDFVHLHAAKISADGKRLAAVASGEGSRGSQLFICDLSTGEQQRRGPYQLQHGERVHFIGRTCEVVPKPHAVFAPDGESMSVGLGDRVGIEEMATGSLLAMLPRDVAAPLVFSPDGRLVAAIGKRKEPSDTINRLSLIETVSGEEVVHLEVGEFDAVAFTPDSRGLVVANKRNLRVWDTNTGERLHQKAWPESICDTHNKTEISSLALLPDGRVATAMIEGDILVWDRVLSLWPVLEPMADLSRKALDTVWFDLAGETRRAHRAISLLTAAPVQGTALLNERLQPVVVDEKRIQKLLADLNSDSFAAREVASRELALIRFRADPLLRRSLEGKPSRELRRRLEAILAEPKRPPAEALRTLRAIAVLERIGTPEARRILEKLSGGDAARETQEAKAALERLKRR